MISGRTAHERRLRQSQVEHEGTGIHDAQRAIEFKRGQFEGRLQPLADDDLKDVAGFDVLDALAYGLLEVAPLKVRDVVGSDAAGRGRCLPAAAE